MGRSHTIHCPNCGPGDGKIRTLRGIVYYRGAKIGILACPSCGGFWHKYTRREAGRELPMTPQGLPDWDQAAADVKSGKAFR